MRRLGVILCLAAACATVQAEVEIDGNAKKTLVSKDAAAVPTTDPTVAPTKDPTAAPTKDPTVAPTNDPTAAPTLDPTADAPSPTSTALTDLLTKHGLLPAHIQIIKDSLMDTIDPEKLVDIVKHVPFSNAIFPNVSHHLGKLSPVVQKLFESAMDSVGGSAPADDAPEGAPAGAAKAMLSQGLSKETVATVLGQINQLKTVKDALQPLMDDADKFRQETANTNEKARKEVWDKVQIALKDLPELKLDGDLNIDSIQNELNQYLQASSDFDISKMTHDQIDRLVHYGKLMQGVVLTSHAPHMANGEIGVLLPGRNPFHYPTGETHLVETKEIIETSQYAHVAGSRATLGSSYSKTTKHKHAAAAWWDGFAGAEADTSESTYARSKNEAHNSKSLGSGNQKLKVMTQESHANMMQFLVADADFSLSQEFEDALLDCETAYKERTPKDSIDVYEYHDRAPRWLLREFGTHFATSARLGGSYYLDATIAVSHEKTEAQTQEALKFATQNHGGNSKEGVVIIPVAAEAKQDGEDHVETKTKTVNVYSDAALEQSKKDVSMHVHVTGGKYGNLTEWQKEVSENPDSWRVIDREFSRRLRPVWELVYKSKLLDKENVQAVSDMLKRAWLRMAFDEKSDHGKQEVPWPTTPPAGVNLWPEHRTTLDVSSCWPAACDLGLVKTPENYELSFQMAIYANEDLGKPGKPKPDKALLSVTGYKNAVDGSQGSGGGFVVVISKRKIAVVQSTDPNKGQVGVQGPEERGEKGDGIQYLEPGKTYDIVIKNKNSKLELSVNCEIDGKFLPRTEFYGAQAASTYMPPTGIGHLMGGFFYLPVDICEAGSFCDIDCAKKYPSFDEAKGCANAAKGYCCKNTKPAKYPFTPKSDADARFRPVKATISNVRFVALDGDPPTSKPTAFELRDSSGNCLFTLDPAAEPPCCKLWGLAAKPETGKSWPLVNSGECVGGKIKTAQEWMDWQAKLLLGGDTKEEGICLADGYYTISCDPAP